MNSGIFSCLFDSNFMKKLELNNPSAYLVSALDRDVSAVKGRSLKLELECGDQSNASDRLQIILTASANTNTKEKAIAEYRSLFPLTSESLTDEEIKVMPSALSYEKNITYLGHFVNILHVKVFFGIRFTAV